MAVGEIVHKSIELFFQEGSSDKLYHAQIVELNGTFTVRVQWGRRGAGFNTGTKAVNVTRDKAERAFASVVREKTNKGYQQITAQVQPAAVAPPVGQGSGTLAGAVSSKNSIGVRAQLLTPTDSDAELELLLSDDAMVAQQKLDGIRILTLIDNESIIAANRNGEHTDKAPAQIMAGLKLLPDGTVLDGELVADKYWLFDVLRFGGQDVAALPYEQRLALLTSEVKPVIDVTSSKPTIAFLRTAIGHGKKRTLYKKLVDEGCEGIVFKQRGAPYTPGRPSSGGTQRKHKLVKSCDVVITANAGNAYAMAVHDPAVQGALVDVGKVFAGTTNESRQEIDQLLGSGAQPIAEVRYLYATDDEQLFQAVFVRLRDDKIATECGRAQLKKTSKAVVE